MVALMRLKRDSYLDSVALLAAIRGMSESDGVEWASAVMATPANVAGLEAEGFDGDALSAAGANDLLLAVRARTEQCALAALDAGDDALFTTSAHEQLHGRAARSVRSLDAAVTAQTGSNVVIVSVPGAYAALEAHKALAAGLDVLLFSDNVSVDDEVALKDHAAAVGHLVMGPGAGTAVLGGCGLGFANVVSRGRVGVVAAAGTGAQEVMALLDRAGEGVSQVIGVGGRDLSTAVGGRMARLAVQALDRDPNTDVILLVSKPPALDVARSVVGSASSTPVVAGLIGVASDTNIDGASAVSPTLEGAVTATLRLLGRPRPDYSTGLVDEVVRVLPGLAQERTLISGLYSGGTLCYEALTLLQPLVGAVWSNTPLDKQFTVPAPAGAHVCLDLGEEEYTKGRPHPMIDPQARIEWLHRVAVQDDLAVVVLDVVLGDGAHADPLAELGPVCAAIAWVGGPRVVVYVLGTQGDPQGLARQREGFQQVGCLVAPTAARAALAAAAIALRQPELVGRGL